MKAHLNRLRAVAMAGGILMVSGCALIEPVQPWEKGVLAKPEMTFEGDRMDLYFTEHMHASREGSSGGTGAGGGGCGCY
ncbi:MAG: DUF4266 domain-containing protein [Rhodocyclaceae bacterium]|nr:MAG: DUF4266 domain-containing protein [Rhodocyclaceae bacterium]